MIARVTEDERIHVFFNLLFFNLQTVYSIYLLNKMFCKLPKAQLYSLPFRWNHEYIYLYEWVF